MRLTFLHRNICRMFIIGKKKIKNKWKGSCQTLKYDFNQKKFIDNIESHSIFKRILGNWHTSLVGNQLELVVHQIVGILCFGV